MTPPRKPTDPAARILAVLGDVVGMAEAEMAALRKAKRDPKKLDQAMKLASALHPLLGQLRRHGEAAALAGNTLSPAAVIAYLRKLPAAQREDLLAEVGGADEDTGRGPVLG